MTGPNPLRSRVCWVGLIFAHLGKLISYKGLLVMTNRFSFAARVACYMFSLSLLACGSAHAALLRYDVVLDEEQVGHLVFDAELGASSQNLWGSLVDWAVGWDEALLDRSNSTANINGRFFIDASGNVTDDGLESIFCAGAAAGFPFCGPQVIVTGNPAFEGNDGSSIEFVDSSFVGGVVIIGSANGDFNTEYGTLIYSGPASVSHVVPIAATAWLFGSALLGLMGVARRKKV
jgi:hypothetical protein